MQDVDERDDEPQPRGPCSDEPAEPEQHSLLVLFDDLHGESEAEEGQEADHDDENDQGLHCDAPWDEDHGVRGVPGTRSVRRAVRRGIRQTLPVAVLLADRPDSGLDVRVREVLPQALGPRPGRRSWRPPHIPMIRRLVRSARLGGSVCSGTAADTAEAPPSYSPASSGSSGRPATGTPCRASSAAMSALAVSGGAS